MPTSTNIAAGPFDPARLSPAERSMLLERARPKTVFALTPVLYCDATVLLVLTTYASTLPSIGPVEFGRLRKYTRAGLSSTQARRLHLRTRRQRASAWSREPTEDVLISAVDARAKLVELRGNGWHYAA